jgi:nucleoside-specific outer membrane channel protein Tsx
MINSIEEINPTFEEFKFNWYDSYGWGQHVLHNHNKVVAYKITEEYCFVLLKSKIKFFGFKFHITEKSIKRIDTKIFINNKRMVICDEKLFDIFRKLFILENL